MEYRRGNQYVVTFNDDGTMSRQGVDEKPCTVLYYNAATQRLVYKIPGGTYWAAIGRQGYAGTRTAIATVLYRFERNGRKYYRIENETDYPVRSDVDYVAKVRIFAPSKEEYFENNPGYMIDS